MDQVTDTTINPTREDAYWQREYTRQPYYLPELSYA